MILQQIYLACLSHSSYLIGDERSHTAAVVDPQRDIDGYLAEAKKRGLKIEHVFLTHFHADFLAGHIELAARTGARIYLGAKSRAEFEFTPLHDGDKIEFGDVRLEILETPGHTPEGISIVVFDQAKDARTPQAVLTGDTLFIGDVGRPDLLAAEGLSARDLALMMYDTLRNKYSALPDSTIVYPAHGAGSACGKQMSADTFSSLGAQRSANWALQPMEREAFVRELTSAQPDLPPYFAFDSMANRKQHVTLDENLQRRLVPLFLEQALESVEAGAWILDAREPSEWAAGHLVGSINVGLSGKYASWVGAIIEAERELVLVAPAGKEREAALRLGRIGFDRIAGFLAGGETAWRERPELVRTSRRVDAAQLASELAQKKPPFLLDVRTQTEWDEGHLEHAVHVPLTQLQARTGELPRDRAIAIHCKGGYRSVIAASLLERAGLGPLSDLEGGYMAWIAEKMPIVPVPA
jgi:glyoxylase-like metal-dependent hydrolase (beta-lactamase superfamily II)/rhodanese-related sulfurtransferase